MTAEITRLPLLDYAGAEALNVLCTNLSFTGRDRRVIMVTSCVEAEGKSFVSMNLARTLSQLGKRVVLVDADLRRSVLNSRYGIRLPQGAFGLAHYLADMCPPEGVLYDTNYPGVYFIPVGRTVTNSLALLNTPRLGELLHRLATQVDYVIVDTPPVGAVIDPAEIAKSCDGALIVVSSGKVRRRDLSETRQQIEMAGCEVLGAVLNGVDPNALGSRRYYYAKKYYKKQYGSGDHLPRGDKPVKKVTKPTLKPARPK
ncbi:MAG TPA: CpsD/CapB family tyrosine-protein kinase [Candidatus Limnocylindria bacterium]|nr:CpsD/CapB family tyrosine-protein kinase [Candidatus Limnocylindria bacterium]